MITVRRERLHDRARPATVEPDGAALRTVAADRSADSNAGERLGGRVVADQRGQALGKIVDALGGLDPATQAVCS